MIQTVDFRFVAVADLPDIIHELDRSLTSIEVVVDPDSKKVEIAKLEEESAAPDLWNTKPIAQRVTSSALAAAI